MIALSNGNISLNNLSLFDNKNKSKKTIESEASNSTGKVRKRKSTKSSTNKPRKKKSDNTFGFNINDIDTGMKLMDLSEDDLERGMEIITRTKKYMSTDERKILVKVESVLDLVRGIKKLSSIDIMEEDETDFFRSMDEEDKKNMMIKEILEVFPEKRKDSLNKAIDIKKKIDLFAELFLPDDFGEGGFSLSSLANINNLGSMGNLKLLGSLLRADDDEEDYDEDEYEDTDKYIEEEYEDDFDYSKYENDEDDT